MKFSSPARGLVERLGVVLGFLFIWCVSGIAVCEIFIRDSETYSLLFAVTLGGMLGISALFIGLGMVTVVLAILLHVTYWCWTGRRCPWFDRR